MWSPNPALLLPCLFFSPAPFAFDSLDTHSSDSTCKHPGAMHSGPMHGIFQVVCTSVCVCAIDCGAWCTNPTRSRHGLASWCGCRQPYPSTSAMGWDGETACRMGIWRESPIYLGAGWEGEQTSSSHLKRKTRLRWEADRRQLPVSILRRGKPDMGAFSFATLWCDGCCWVRWWQVSLCVGVGLNSQVKNLSPLCIWLHAH